MFMVTSWIGLFLFSIRIFNQCYRFGPYLTGSGLIFYNAVSGPGWICTGIIFFISDPQKVRNADLEAPLS